jgi:hypothetical protein
MMYQNQVMDKNAYPLVEYMNDLKNSIFTNGETDIYRRNLQRNYVGSLISLLNSKPAPTSRFSDGVTVSENSDVTAVVRGTLKSIKDEAAQKTATDLINKYHYDDLVYRIDKALDPK